MMSQMEERSEGLGRSTRWSLCGRRRPVLGEEFLDSGSTCLWEVVRDTKLVEWRREVPKDDKVKRSGTIPLRDII